MKKKLLSIILGIVILCVGFFAGMEYKAYQIKTALQSVFNGKTTTTNSSAAQSTDQTVMEKAKIEEMNILQKAIGDDVKLSALSLKVTRSEEKQIVNSNYGTPKTAKEGTKFIVISMEITNITNSVFSFFPDDGLILIDNANREFKTFSDTIGSIENYLNSRELSPSIKESGVIVYEIPKDSTGYTLVTSKAGSKELYKIVLK